MMTEIDCVTNCIIIITKITIFTTDIQIPQSQLTWKPTNNSSSKIELKVFIGYKKLSATKKGDMTKSPIIQGKITWYGVFFCKMQLLRRFINCKLIMFCSTYVLE